MSESQPHPDLDRPLPVAVPLPESVPAGAGLPPRAPAGTNGTRRAEKNGEAKKPPRKEIAYITLLLEYSPPWLVSMVFHMLLLIVMGLIIFSRASRPPVQLDAAAASYDKVEEPAVDNSAAGGLPEGSPDGEGAVWTPPDLKAVDNPFAGPGKIPIRPGGHEATGNLDAVGIAWSDRGNEIGGATKKARIGDRGGNDITQLAVERGLEWLARNQQRDGSWSLAGPYSDGVSSRDENQAAATAMALLAFQGNGNTINDGKYKKNVAKAWNWLLKQQDNTGSFFQFGNYTHRFYTQGMCSIAICELYGMTKDSRYRAPAQSAIDYCLKTQSPQGGWRYNPNSESDVSVTGWIVMALQSAKMAGLTVPAETLHKVEKFLDSAASPGTPGYRYQATDMESVRPSMTAEALLMREYLGWKHDDPRLAAGIDWITSPANLIDYKHNRNVYYWYYATQATFHWGGAPWDRWNSVMRKVMPAQQIPHGHEGGSWNPRGTGDAEDDQFAGSGGRLYVTCLSIYMLEVYYRHMPLYQHVYSDAAPPPQSSNK
jgi:hypothetical protein